MREKITEIVKRINPELMKYPKEWINEERITSYEVILLLSELEDEFGLMIEPEEIIPDNFNSLDSVIALIERYQSNV